VSRRPLGEAFPPSLPPSRPPSLAALNFNNFLSCRCHICGQQAPDLKSMQAHHDSKHPKLPWEPEKCQNVHVEAGGVTTQGVAVRGSIYKVDKK
jgi:hypothetical protein